MQPQRRFRRALGVLVVFIAAPIALGACAFSGSSASYGGRGPITVGVLEPLSGEYSAPGLAAVDAVRTAVGEINAAGGITALGRRKLRVVVVDSTTDDPVAGTAAANQLMASNPSFVIGPFVSTVALAASTVFERDRVPECVGSFSDELTTRGYRYLFELPPTASTIAQTAVTSFGKVLSQVDPAASKVAAVYDSDPGESVVPAFAADLSAQTKYKVPLSLEFQSGLTDASPIAQKIVASGSQVLVPGATTAELEEILGSLSADGQDKLTIFNPGGGAPATASYVQALKNLVDGQFVLPTWDFDMRLSAAQDALLARANHDYVSAYPSEPFMDQFAGEDYTCANVMVQAIENARSANPTAIRNAVAGHTFSSGAASLMPPGRVSFNEAGLNTAAVPLVSEWCHEVLETVAPTRLAATTPKSVTACGRR